MHDSHHHHRTTHHAGFGDTVRNPAQSGVLSTALERAEAITVLDVAGKQARGHAQQLQAAGERSNRLLNGGARGANEVIAVGAIEVLDLLSIRRGRQRAGPLGS